MKHHRASRYVLAILVIVLAMFLATSLAAQDNISDDEVNEVASELYCPVCESTPLDVCPTQACADWRELIRTQLSGGASKQDVLDYFARQYGDGVLANPPRRGVSLVVLWVIPILGIGLAALLFARYMRGMRQAEASVAPAGGPSSGPMPDPAARPEKPRPTLDASNTELEAYINQLEQELDD